MRALFEPSEKIPASDRERGEGFRGGMVLRVATFPET